MEKRKIGETRNRRGERGSVLAASALGMLSLILAVGLGVDVTHLYLTKNELQNAADSAALAGASGLNFTPSGISDATTLAIEKMNSYRFQNMQVVFLPEHVRFARNLSDFASGADFNQAAASAPGVAPDIKFVKVVTPPSPVNIAFASMVLGNSFNLWAEAVAGVSVPLNLPEGYLPAFVCDSEVATILPGNMYTFRGDPGGFVSPGNYQLLAIDGSGASDDRIGLASGVQNVVGVGGWVQTKPGITAGAVRGGINTRFDDYDSQTDPVNFPPDTNIKEDITYAQYLDPNGPKLAPSHPGVHYRRVVLIPIVKCDLSGGRTDVQIDRFGSFFLRSKVGGGSGGDIQAEYIGIGIVVGSGEYDPTATTNPGPPIRKPVLYQ
ncbi:MAG: pilus assembly protein TadG-related protein [Pyrinomonadaceae bacterium]